MAYRRFHRQSKPTPRNLTVRYAGPCACCGAEIKAGEWATYYPPGTIGNSTTGAIAHVGGLDGTGARCFIEQRKQMAEQAAVNDYAGDGLDARYEDQCRDACER